MQLRQYDAETAKHLMDLAYPGDRANGVSMYVIKSDGVYLNGDCRDLLVEASMDWRPAYEMDWDDSVNPETAPILPIGFTAAQLAAAMLGGVGAGLQEILGSPIGYPLEEEKELPRDFPPAQRWVRDALREAYALAAKVQQAAGALDYELCRRAHALNRDLSAAETDANNREKVWEQGLEPAEYRERRARAKAAVQELRDKAREANARAEAAVKVWRRGMVRYLLGPGDLVLKSGVGTPSKLTAEQKLKVLQAFRDGAKQAQLARQYDVDRRTISDLLIKNNLKLGKLRKEK